MVFSILGKAMRRKQLFNVIKISDGLGNQLSQYAFARKMQMENRGNVYLDTRFINNEDRIARGEISPNLKYNDRRRYVLDKFRIVLPIADESLLSAWDYIIPSNRKERIMMELAQAGFGMWQYRNEDKIKKGKNLKLGNYFTNTYYQGYYFNLEYYKDIRKVLQKDFRLRFPMRLPKELEHIIRCGNTVSVHIRRGDYVKLHCSISRDKYYSKAVKVINMQLSNPIFLLFSDDIAWVKENLKIKGTVIYISDMGFADYEEFTIMKHCRHNIIANSTFSYWAAYLNDNPGKIVLYPASWKKAALIPDGWRKI